MYKTQCIWGINGHKNSNNFFKSFNESEENVTCFKYNDLKYNFLYALVYTKLHLKIDFKKSTKQYIKCSKYFYYTWIYRNKNSVLKKPFFSNG